uniref:Uncharacterized protein n=1 Tax=Lygus hesperus TaxID=30085 RepID=A0A0A9WU08_LYGHE
MYGPWKQDAAIHFTRWCIRRSALTDGVVQYTQPVLLRCQLECLRLWQCWRDEPPTAPHTHKYTRAGDSEVPPAGCGNAGQNTSATPDTNVHGGVEEKADGDESPTPSSAAKDTKTTVCALVAVEEVRVDDAHPAQQRVVGGEAAGTRVDDFTQEMPVLRLVLKHHPEHECAAPRNGACSTVFSATFRVRITLLLYVGEYGPVRRWYHFLKTFADLCPTLRAHAEWMEHRCKWDSQQG